MLFWLENDSNAYNCIFFAGIAAMLTMNYEKELSKGFLETFMRPMSSPEAVLYGLLFSLGLVYWYKFNIKWMKTPFFNNCARIINDG